MHIDYMGTKFSFLWFIFAKFNPLNPVWLPRKCRKTKRVGRCELFAFFIIYFLKDIFLNNFLINQMDNLFYVISIFFLICCLFWVVAQSLQVLFTSLNSPSQLTNWKSSGGDPCVESWTGVTCEGSAVVSMYESKCDSLIWIW